MYKIDEARYFGSNRPTKHRWVQLLHLSNDSRTYRKIVKNRWWYTSSKSHRLKPENSFAITNDQEYIQILSFIWDGDKGLGICKLLQTQSNSEDNYMPIRRVVAYATGKSAKNISEIHKICVFLTIWNVNFICAVSHQYY